MFLMIDAYIERGTNGFCFFSFAVHTRTIHFVFSLLLLVDLLFIIYWKNKTKTKTKKTSKQNKTKKKEKKLLYVLLQITHLY